MFQQLKWLLGENALTGPRAQRALSLKGPKSLKSPPRVFCLFLSNNDVTIENIGCKLKPVDLYCPHYHQHEYRCDLQAVVKHQAKITFFLITFVVW